MIGMEIKILNAEERRTCHKLFRTNDLFRQWHPILTEVEYVIHMDAISVWYNADMVLRHLRACIDYRDEELNFVHSEIARTIKGTSLSAIMAVVLTHLMNATEEGHEEEDIPNDRISMAILKKHHEDSFFCMLMNVFFKRDIGNDGKKVVITPSDPMTQNTSLDDMDDEAKKEVNAYKDKVMEVTKGLKVYFKDWNDWEKLWENICLDVELLNLLQVKTLRGNNEAFNLKMVYNVVGMYANVKANGVSISLLNRALRGNNLRSYISNHRAYGTSDSALSKEQHAKIQKLI